MAGGSNWALENVRDASDLYTKEGTGENEGKIAWFLRKQTSYTIATEERGYSKPDALGSKSGSLVFSVGSSTYSHILAGDAEFVCLADEKTIYEKPTPYLKHTQVWQYMNTEAQQVTDWFTP